MSTRSASSFAKALAKFCLHCPVCRRARRRQRGVAFWLVKRIEAKSCPFCRAYERVRGRKAHERITPKD
jgi:transposase-like protein